MLSILIPTYNYNVAPLVKRLVAESSTLNRAIEIVVIDDASTQYLEENASISQKQNVRFTRLAQNVGRTAVRHQLAEVATYSTLLFIDADVFPVHADFIERYLEACSEQHVVFGGITYHEKPPEASKILRWKYGHAREKQDVKTRQNTPYTSLTTGCFTVGRDIFLSISKTIQLKAYGMDLVLKQKFEDLAVPVVHIDNPVYHNGLETNDVFLKKALEAVETTVTLEQKGWLPNHSRSIQKSYLQLQKWKALTVFQLFFKTIQSKVRHNLRSKNPRLFWFDLFRLNHYITLKRK